MNRISVLTPLTANGSTAALGRLLDPGEAVPVSAMPEAVSVILQASAAFSAGGER
ncbi:hypothetical protein [Streptomyces sp. NPDC050485]|uniref:hypothetical protein n=1 Tax=Streptomyces sp. NPDC050485 TaxID=3365617 RepID=UPI0037AAC75A